MPQQELQRRREEELTGLQGQLEELTAQLETLELNMKKYNASMQQMAELQTKRERANQEDKEAYKIKKQTFDLLPNADENIAKLQVWGQLEMSEGTSNLTPLLAQMPSDIFNYPSSSQVGGSREFTFVFSFLLRP